MSQSLVQTGAEILVSGGTSGNVTLNGVAAGNLLTASCVNYSNGSATFSASDGINAWQSAVSELASAIGKVAQILYAANVAAGNTTVTITASGSISFTALVQEWSGSATISPLAASDSLEDSGNATSHKASASGIDPAAPCIALVVAAAFNAPSSFTAGAGYNGETSSNAKVFYEYQIFSSAPPSEHGNYTTGSSVRCCAAIAAFKGAAGTGSAGAFIGGGLGSFISA